MKKFIYSIAVALAIIATPACKFVDYDLNIDPNNPADLSVKQLLPAAEVSYAYILGGDMGRYVSLWSQHHMGFDRQHLAFDVYQLTESDVNATWDNCYTTVLSNLRIIREKSVESNSPHYAGIAKVLEAMVVSNMVDLWDDIPYSAALGYDRNLQPAFDNSADIYNNLIVILDEAIVDLGSATSTLKPGADDVIFGGSVAKWLKVARATKARLLLHRSKIDAGAYAAALTALDGGSLASNTDNAMVTFADAAVSNNPWFQFDDQRGDVVMGGFFIDLLNTLGDPRRAAFASPTAGGTYVGAHAGVSDEGPGASRFGPFYASANSPVPFMTFAEAKFIEAEAAFPTDKVRAAAAYNDAVKGSLAMFSIADAGYEATNAAETDLTITLEKIMTQKYIALYTSVEPFNDWRRTGIPALPPAAGQTVIARRWPVAQDERVYNGANAAPYLSKTVFDRVFWDN